MLTERAPDFYTNGGWGDTLEYASHVVAQTIHDHQLEPCNLLDAACGDGRFAEAFQLCGFAVTGFDISMDAIETATRTHRGPAYHVADAETPLPWAGCFDVVYCRGISHTGVPRDRRSDLVFKHLSATLDRHGLLILERNTDGTGIDGPSRYFPNMLMANPTASQLTRLVRPFFDVVDVLRLDGRIQISARPR